MKASITVLIILIVAVTGYKLYEYWDKVSQEKELQQMAGKPKVTEGMLEGVPRGLENSLAEARAAGPSALHLWIEKYKGLKQVKDPRLAWIELDYVVLLAGQDPVEAKRIFAEVKKRTPEDSLVYTRIKELSPTYE